MSKMRRIATLFLVSLTLVPAMTKGAFSADRPGKLTPLRIAIVSRSTLDMPYFVARGRGFFREEGLEAEIILMKAIQTVQALLGGSIDFGTATGTAVSAAVNGADVYRAVQGGLTTTKATISERPELVTKAVRATLRAVRLIRNDRKYSLEFMKGPYLDLGKERERFAKRAYDAAVEGYLLSGVVDEKLQREMITVAAQRIKPQQPVTPERVFDFSFARKVSEALR